MAWWPFRRRYQPPTHGRRPFPRFLRQTFRVISWALLLCFLLGMGWFGYAFYRFVFYSGYFLVREVRIEIEKEPLTGDEVRVDRLIKRELSKNKVYDANLLKVRSDDLRRDLEKIPQLKSAVVRKEYPHLLTVRVKQRQMRALILQDGIFSIDSEGAVLETLGTRDIKATQYPYISGLDLKNLEPGVKIQSESLTKALHLLTSLQEKAPALHQKISDVHFDKEKNLSLLLKGGVEVRFGRGEPLKKMPYFETFLVKEGPAEKYEYIDLRYEGQVSAMPRRASHPDPQK